MDLHTAIKPGSIAFQGEEGAFSHLAAMNVFPDRVMHPCPRSFLDVIEAVEQGHAAAAVIPVDNTIAGRVADVHRLLPKSTLHIVGETYLKVRHCLLGTGALEDVTDIYSHVHALDQCEGFRHARNLTRHTRNDTAGAAAMVARDKDPTKAAIASEAAAAVYGLNILARDIQDDEDNATRFLILTDQPIRPAVEVPSMSTLWVQVKDIPSALYRMLGCFAINGVQMTNIESYRDERFKAARFLCDVEGHPDDAGLKQALAELPSCAADIRILGVYPKNRR